MLHALLSLFLLTTFVSACSSTPPEQAPYQPGFFYLSLDAKPTLIISRDPNTEPRKNIPLDPPTDCTFFALHPAPLGRWIAVEWECSFGPTVELFDSAAGASHFVLSDPTIDSRFLAWQPNGLWLYLKIGTLSVPQTLKVNAATGKATDLQISPFAYDLTDSPDGKRVLYSLTKGIGFGSETWVAGPEGQNPSQLVVDATNITAFAQYSPGGSQIAYILFPDSQTTSRAGELWVMDKDGFVKRKLADAADAGQGFSPTWSPDGTKIAFVGREQPANPALLNISIYDLNTAQLTSVKISPTTQPVWSPDGTQIIFGSRESIGTGDGTPTPAVGDTMNVWLYEINSGQAKLLVSGHACCAGWIR